ncbi:uncharacterized protein LOC102355862 isoform X1 [Latimeria chalumnae]|uniref:uncharacterized protein LOC102355862 isoform X1 n=1 Tax=Latimeria chalumnae TaxID=7897 RepID=UPI0003C1AA4C|nr:PREDICTED: uncharacterized protein LOC102355862 isoform X1 [Latimeria chalumnae]|eukprot:XP_006005576.1 PREDICTED: uncharacterized protein LOC102355862 isoform X1 [Latimeria chalumnae]
MSSELEKKVLPPLCLKGFLEKRRQMMKFHWRCYKFVLEDTILSYYRVKSEEDEEGVPWGKIDMRFVQSVRATNHISYKFPFEVVLHSGKVIILSAQTADQRADWLKFLWQSMHLAVQEEQDFGTPEPHQENDFYNARSSEEEEEVYEKLNKKPHVRPRLTNNSYATSKPDEAADVPHYCRAQNLDAGLELPQDTEPSTSTHSKHTYEIMKPLSCHGVWNHTQTSGTALHKTVISSTVTPGQCDTATISEVQETLSSLYDVPRKIITEGVTSHCSQKASTETGESTDEDEEYTYSVPRSVLAAPKAEVSPSSHYLLEDADQFIDETFNGITYNRESQLVSEEMMTKLKITG